MRKSFLTALCFFALFQTSFSQVGIGTTAPNASSVLDLNSTTKAFIPPRMTTAQRDQIANPVAGMMIFNSTTNCIEIYRTGGWYNLCTGGGGSTGGPTSDSVANSNLIGHWTFDTDNKEVISNSAAATASGVTYASAGRIGNCATFSNGYLVYNPIPLISRDTALQSYTISMWVNMPAATGADPLKSLFQITGNRFPDLWGNVAFELLNNGVAGDTLALNARQVQVDGTAPYVHNESAGINYGNSTNKWTFLTQTYDGSGTHQTLKIYANGTLIKTQELTTVDKSVSSTQSTFRIVPTGASGTLPTPANKVYIGTLAFADRGNNAGDGYGNFAPNAVDRPWAAGSITGKIDDTRLFNKALSSSEITDLYNYGLQGK